jgi:ubiquitin carboxyl-terminal hydrolase L5
VSGVQFEELISLDPTLLHALSPVYGVIFLFKYPTTALPSARSGTPSPAAAESLFFAKQTIQNACGTQALLSVLLNVDTDAPSGAGVRLGDELAGFKEFTRMFPAEFRGEALSNSERIREVHNSFSKASPFSLEEQRSAGEDDDVYHFIAYTPIDGVLYELDGLQDAPLSHGACSFEEFPEKVVPVLQARIARYPAEEIRFNLLAMVRDLRIRARETGDEVLLMQEEAKRNEWMFENALRRHNFVGFGTEVLKAVMREKIREGGYEEWIERAKKASARRAEERKKGRDYDEEMAG